MYCLTHQVDVKAALRTAWSMVETTSTWSAALAWNKPPGLLRWLMRTSSIAKAVPVYSIWTLVCGAPDLKCGQSQLNHDLSKLNAAHHTLMSPHLDSTKLYKSPCDEDDFIHPNSSLASCRYLVLSAFHLSK